MKFKFIGIILFLLTTLSAHALENKENLFDNNDWRGAYCSSYGDGLFQGTYNYRFKGNGQIESYIEYYTDLSCKTKTGYNDIQTQGTYKLKNMTHQNDWVIYDLEVKLNHLNYLLYFKLKIKQNNMTLCWDSSRCLNYVKILN
ncbi:MAG: hypothetical protein K2X69_08280 [Silvanigrellaceae bacterium]|nr:hypothetical protein [Silvanigrellaceae bacterium]